MTKAVSDGNGIPIPMDGVEIMASEGLVLSHSFPDNDFVCFFWLATTGPGDRSIKVMTPFLWDQTGLGRRSI